MSRPEPSFRLKLVLEQQLSLDELAELDDVRKAYAALLRDILTDNDLAAWWEDRPIERERDRRRTPRSRGRKERAGVP